MRTAGLRFIQPLDLFLLTALHISEHSLQQSALQSPKSHKIDEISKCTTVNGASMAAVSQRFNSRGYFEPRKMPAREYRGAISPRRMLSNTDTQV
eukprot:1456310-Pleurochrysis_carterae.AAC.1